MPEQTLYDVLGVTPDATPAEIEAAHRRQLKYWHPDRNRRVDADKRAKSINHVYDVLSNPAQRADYDRSLSSPRSGSGPTSAGAPPPPPPPAPVGFGWGSWVHGSRVELLMEQSRAAIGWLVQPLRQPTLTRRFVGALIVRVAALAVTAGLLSLVVPVLVAAVQFVVGLLALAAMITLFALALGSKGSRRRRRR